MLSNQKRSIIILLIFTLAVSFVINGCSEIVQNSNIINVQGKLMKITHQPLSNAVVKVGSQSVTTDINGNFNLSNVTVPYDLSVIDSAGLTYETFKKLSISLVNFEISTTGGSITNDAEINITIPAGSLQGTHKKAFFTDFNKNNFFTTTVSSTSSFFPLSTWFSDNTPIRGKIIVLSYNLAADSSISEYTNFGMSEELTITIGSTINYSFNDSQLTMNPGENIITGTVGHPPGFTTSFPGFYITFGSSRTPFFLSEGIACGLHDNFTVAVPTGLPVSFNTALYNISSNPEEIFTTSNFLLPNSGTISLNTPQPLYLDLPTNGASNVDTLTVFSINGGEGIYKYWFTDNASQRNYCVSTIRPNITFAEVRNLAGIDLRNRSFTWYVTKYNNANSFDEYVKSYAYSLNREFIDSEHRTFTTAP